MKNKYAKRCWVIVLSLMAFFLITNHAVAASKQPNVILIMVDDLGYNDLSCYGSETIKTPILDKMAEDGIRLTSFYAGATVCTPSRMALLSGSYPPRVGWKGGVMGYDMKTNTGLSPQVLTIAEVFKSAGYATGMCGKWHIGKTDEVHPLKQGFDMAYFIHMSNNQTKKLYRGTTLEEDPFNNKLLTEQFTKESIKFIEENKKTPFFLYMPLTAPHFPAESHPDWKGKSARGAYGDVVEEMDFRMGEMFDVLKKNKLDKKTIVVFLSDNGPEPSQSKFASAAPYTGKKWESKEGGTRVPCIVNWPGVIKPGQESDKLTAAIDLLPTLASACGIKVKIPEGGQKLDGVDVWDTLLGKDSKHPRNDLLYWHGWGTPQAIRVGEWKLYFDKVKGVQGSNTGMALFNLKDDPAEKSNLSAQHPDKVKDMKELALKRLEDIESDFIPLAGKPDHKKKGWKRGAWIKKAE